MTVQETITGKLAEALTPSHLEVVNESHMHSVPPGSESHFKVVIVSDGFEGLPLVRRHMQINQILAAELQGPIHALSMETLTVQEWRDRGETTFESPDCHGGSKADA